MAIGTLEMITIRQGVTLALATIDEDYPNPFDQHYIYAFSVRC
jgi:hypothetical protein